MKRFLSVLIVLSVFLNVIYSQSHKTSQGHTSIVTGIVSACDSKNPQDFFSCSEDGYLIKWNADGEGEHYQVSELWLKLIAVSPKGNEVAIYETDGGSINRVSVWDWKSLKRKYQKNYEDTITSLQYSAKGKYLIVGTSSINGVEFLNASNGSKVSNKLKQSANIVNYIYTSDSEKTAVFYSTSGILSYYNLGNGEQKTKFTVNQSLTQTILFNDAKVLAGVRGNEIYLINAYKGKQISSYPAYAPVLLSTEKDSDLYYLVRESGMYMIYKIVPSDSLDTAKKMKVCQFTVPDYMSAVVSGKKLNDEFILGTKNGEIFKYRENDSAITTISKNTYKSIYDVKKAGEDNSFYLLTNDSIYKTSFEEKQAERIIKTNGQRNFYVFDNKIILWSNGNMTQVTQIDPETQKSEVLFTPGFQIRNLKFYNDGNKKYILEIENNGIINIYDFATKKIKQIYNGTGIQDAVIGGDGFIYIAKSAAIFPNTPLLKVDIKTHETVSVKIPGNISFSLETSSDYMTIYGILFHEDTNDKNTYVFSYNTEKGQYKEILKFNEVDTDAFTTFDDTTLFTNIGKNFIYSYNIKKNKKMTYKRSAAIPSFICQNKDYVIILNSNGSISWAKSSSNAILEDWYMLSGDEWQIISKK